MMISKIGATMFSPVNFGKTKDQSVENTKWYLTKDTLKEFMGSPEWVKKKEEMIAIIRKQIQDPGLTSSERADLYNDIKLIEEDIKKFRIPNFYSDVNDL